MSPVEGPPCAVAKLQSNEDWPVSAKLQCTKTDAVPCGTTRSSCPGQNPDIDRSYSVCSVSLLAHQDAGLGRDHGLRMAALAEMTKYKVGDNVLRYRY